MGILSKLATGAGIKTLTGAVGGAASAAYGTLSGIGKAFGTLSSATQDASKATEEKKSEESNVIFVNFGMAGSAAKQKIVGTGTLPIKPKVVKPQVSEKMPTEALLDIVVKYLNSIDKTLKAELEFEKANYEQQIRDQREAIVENNKPSFNFSDIKDRLSGFKSNIKENTGFAMKMAKYAIGLGAVSALIASAMDQKELDALKENVNQFKANFGWLGELGAVVGAGGLFGFLFGGKGFVGRLKGGLVGMVASHVLDRLYSSFAGEYKKDENGNVLLNPTTGEPIKESRSMSVLGTSLSVAAGAFAARSIVKKLPEVRQAGTATRSLAKAATAGSIVEIQAATRKGTSWLASRRGRKFLVFLGRKLGKGLLAKLGKYLARIVASVLLTTTGVGAIPGIVSILFNVAFIAWDLYDIATAIWDAWNESAAEDTALPGGVSQPDATQVGAPGVVPSTGITTKSETGKPEEAQSFFESKGWTKEQAAGIVGNLYVESGLKTDAVGDGGQAYGIAQWHPDRQSRFQQVYGKSIRESNFKEQLEFVNWELNNSEKKAGQLLKGAATAEDAAAIVDQYYERSSGAARAQRMTNAGSIIKGDYANLQGGGGGSGGLAGAVAKGADMAIEATGKLFGILGSSVIRPGVERKFEPSTPNISERINSDSMKLQNDITFGISKSKAKDIITTPATPGIGPSMPQPIKSISSIDPNYGNIDSVKTYLAHFRMAA